MKRPKAEVVEIMSSSDEDELIRASTSSIVFHWNVFKSGSLSSQLSICSSLEIPIHSETHMIETGACRQSLIAFVGTSVTVEVGLMDEQTIHYIPVGIRTWGHTGWRELGKMKRDNKIQRSRSKRTITFKQTPFIYPGLPCASPFQPRESQPFPLEPFQLHIDPRDQPVQHTRSSTPDPVWNSRTYRKRVREKETGRLCKDL